MKLNYKRTILVGFAFFLIMAFWQAYDATIPVILTNKFGMSQGWSGLIMALDNILALFMLPLFGALSDKCKAKSGKRTPFIVVGTIIAAIALLGLAYVDGQQKENLVSVSNIDMLSKTDIYYMQKDAQLQTPEGEAFVLSELYTQEEFHAIKSEIFNPETGKTETNLEYTNYVVPARQACAAQITAENPVPLIWFVALLLIILVAMATFRSPAVALMPDVTIKPLRSKANAVINLMGTAGGILVLVLGILFKTSSVKNQLMRYYGYYGVVAGIMLVSLFIFVTSVWEPLWAKQMREESVRLGLEDEEEESNENRKLSKGERTSLVLILASVALWYFGYNAVTSKYAVYAGNILNMDYNTTLLLAQGAAIVAYMPAGIVASKIGRKKTILAGVVMLTAAFGAASFMRAGSSVLVMNVLFALAGIGWATINVNSFPMVVELCSGGNIGRYTGYYYTASMAAQIATPVFSGMLMDMDGVGMTVLFPYAAIFAGLAFVTMLFVRHGDTKPEGKRGLEALDIDD